jgi:hypothetical protein
LNTASPLEAAKKAITGSSETDPELDETMSSAHRYQLDLAKEQNRHAEAKHKLDLGAGGWFLGGEKNAPGVIAGLAVFFGLLAFGMCLIMAKAETQNLEFWGRNAERSLAFASAALAYIFLITLMPQ